jgi:hypothetical protein
MFDPYFHLAKFVDTLEVQSTNKLFYLVYIYADRCVQLWFPGMRDVHLSAT